MPVTQKATVLSAALLLPALVFAGGTAVIESGQGEDRVSATLEFDGDKLRMRSAPGQGEQQMQGEMIFRDGKVYAVVNNEGTPMVMEMGGMMKMVGNIAKQQGGGTDAYNDVGRYHGLTPTGRNETVGGARGEVYRLDYTTQAGQRETTEVVLSSNVAARDMTASMTVFGAAMAQASGIVEPEGARQLQAEIIGKKMGVLRYGDEFRVTSISSQTPPAGNFKLPAAPTQMPDLSGFGGLGAGAEGSAAAGGGLGAIFGGKAERQKERIESRTEGEADAATDRAVDKVLDKAFGKIFGN